MSVVDVGYDSANYYLIGGGRRRLLVDVGFPGTMPKLLAAMRRKGAALEEVGHLLCTHYHPDHAGLAQELAERGVRLILLDVQAAAVPLLRGMCKPEQGYREVDVRAALRATCAGSRALLAGIGVAGEVLHTPGHSEDSVTLLLDGVGAFTGDLPPPLAVDEGSAAAVTASWAAIRASGATSIFPGHGPSRPVPRETR